MKPFADLLDEEKITKISNYYANLPVPKTEYNQSFDEETLNLGKKLVLRGDWERYLPPCTSCHGLDAKDLENYFLL